MSIAAMSQVAVFGTLSRKPEVLAALQALGCLHLEAAAAGASGGAATEPPDARRALAFLLAAPLRRHPARPGEGFDPDAVAARALAIEQRLEAIEEAQHALDRRLATVEPWGDYALDPALPAHGLRLWFYAVPRHRLGEIPAQVAAWQVVGSDHRFCHVAVVQADEPVGMPVPRAHTGSVARRDLLAERQALDAESDELQAERSALTRWSDALAHRLAERMDARARVAAARGTDDREGLFVLHAWAPQGVLSGLREAGDEHGFAVVRRPDDPAVTPPTLLLNRGAARHGQALLGIYITPHARGWDPSAWVFGAFVLFFGMVVGDLGYALVLAALLLAWRPRAAAAQTLRRLFGWLALSSALWGVSTGTWFGSAPHALTAFAWADGSDVERMMAMAIGIGVAHLVLANLAAARAARGAARLAALGWGAVIGGGAAAAASGLSPAGTATTGFSLALGVALLGFAAATGSALANGQGVLGRIGSLLQSLMRLPSALGDVLSYLRLFALAYAGAALAGAFNGLAAPLAELAGFGGLLAALLLVFGHGLNIVLSVMGGFVHGLRLNFIEFFNWAGIEEGRPFKAFKRQEAPPWTPP